MLIDKRRDIIVSRSKNAEDAIQNKKIMLLYMQSYTGLPSHGLMNDVDSQQAVLAMSFRFVGEYLLYVK